MTTYPITTLQTGHDIEEGQEAKYVVGCILRFLGYEPDEEPGDILEPGDLVRVMSNNSGMGIYVEAIDIPDDWYSTHDYRPVEMVFPEEVEVAE